MVLSRGSRKFRRMTFQMIHKIYIIDMNLLTLGTLDRNWYKKYLNEKSNACFAECNELLLITLASKLTATPESLSVPVSYKP